MLRLHVNPNSLREIGRIARQMENAEELLKERRQLLRKIRKDQAKIWDADFAKGGRHGWIETSAKQKALRRYAGFSETPTLQMTGGTKAWAFQIASSARVNAASVTFDLRNNEGRNAFPLSHHTGYSFGGADVPPREIWTLDATDEGVHEATIIQWVEERLGGLF